MKNFNYTRATTIEDTVGTTQAILIAGGTNLVDRMKVFLDQPTQVIDISRLDLKKIESTENGLRLGALVTNTQVADYPQVRQNYPILSRAILAGASQQIRNVATVGGNLMQRTRCPYYYDTAFGCNKRQPGSGCPAATGINRMHAIFGASDKCVAVNPSDMCVALAALDAVVEVEGTEGRRQIPFSEFHRLPGNRPERDTVLEEGEIITAVILPANINAKSGVYLKLRDRASYSFALISVAAILDIDNNKIRNARIALGGVAHKPWRTQEAEQFLVGKAVDETLFQQAADLALRNAQPLEHNKFKVEMSKRAIRRALMVSANGGGIA
ncbi:molybdopterin dehydrogenase FAD-binding protein [Calothrix sp. NIES-4071]|nr:molybdopterin dehydrogenase FAD-binding protein [Calothrix sp. NIES-4071]BAZ58861.1 molybdopterin dehydrogenase FAD-binding protein [Calothrix sp. NIES-4105]